MLITILVFLLILSILVLVHEAGHFFVAKFFNIKVEEFGIGLPPRAFGKKIGETLYSINWLPIGGFVKLYGEDEAGSGSISLKPQKVSKKDENRAFYSRSVWQRAMVVVAGVFMNFVLAVFLVSILFSVVGVSIPGKNVVVGQVIKGAPAEAAGLKVGDIIESINGVSVSNPTQLVNYSKKHVGEKITLKVIHSVGSGPKSQSANIEVVLRKDYPKDQGPMGIAISQDFITKKYPWWEAPFVGTKEVLNQSALIFSGLFTIVSQLVTKGSIPSDVAGPVGIAQLTGVVCKDWVPCLSLTVLLSINLAIINILPIPALDGGRLLFILIEGVTRKKVSPKIENYAHTIGMFVLLGLIALITLHDLIRVFFGSANNSANKIISIIS